MIGITTEEFSTQEKYPLVDIVRTELLKESEEKASWNENHHVT